jgi:hypothetical protein
MCRSLVSLNLLILGVPLTIVGIIYMMTIGYKLIPDRMDNGAMIGDLDLSDMDQENKKSYAS